MSDQVARNIADRIRKLLAHAAGTPNEAEASVYAEKAAELAREYQLEIADLGEEAAVGMKDATRIKDHTVIDIRHEWHKTLMHTLAENNFVLFWTETRRAQNAKGQGKFRMRTKANMIGRSVNVFLTKETFTYLCNTMARLCPYHDERKQDAQSWYAGCTDRLNVRLAQQRRKAEVASAARRDDRGDGKSIVLTDVFSNEADLNWDMIYGYPAGTTAANRRLREARRAEEAPRPPVQETEEQKIAREKEEKKWWEKYQREQAKKDAKIDKDAYTQGSEAGRNISLDKQVEDSSEEKFQITSK